MEFPELLSELTSDVAAGTGGALIAGLVLTLQPPLLQAPLVPPTPLRGDELLPLDVDAEDAVSVRCR